MCFSRIREFYLEVAWLWGVSGDNQLVVKIFNSFSRTTQADRSGVKFLLKCCSHRDVYWCGQRDLNSQHSDSKSFRVGKQGKTATNKDNNISKMIALHYCHISSNMACFCKLMAQNWFKNLPLVGHIWRNVAIVKSYYLTDIVILVCCSLSLFTYSERLRIWMLGVRVSPPALVIQTDYTDLIPFKLLICANFVPLSIKLNTNSDYSP